jgi:hypothetical protein
MAECNVGQRVGINLDGALPVAERVDPRHAPPGRMSAAPGYQAAVSVEVVDGGERVVDMDNRERAATRPRYRVQRSSVRALD